ncbi:MAG: type II toxin-antitoxin system VapC family toxin [Nanoarchaeota archaeon]|mgnify:FL=1
MKVADTTFLIDLVKGKKETKKLLESGEDILTTQINMYELVRGLFLKSIYSAKFAEIINSLGDLRVLSLDNKSIVKSAEISADLIKKGEVIQDADCLTAGIALSNGINTIITKNVKHFSRIKNLKVESY